MAKRRTWAKSSKDITVVGRKSTKTSRQAIYLCPLPSQLFRVAPLVWLAEQCQAKGEDPLQLEFFAALKRNRRFVMEYVVFGMLKGKEVVVAAKDWPENVLIAKPGEAEQIELARDHFHRLRKATKWVTEDTAAKLVEHGMATWGEDGTLDMGDVVLGTCERVPHDQICSQPSQYSYRKKIEYRKAS